MDRGRRVVFGLHGSIGTSENLQAELDAIHFGLSTAWEAGIRHLVCYTDSQMALDLCKSMMSMKHLYAALLWGIHDLLAREWEVELLHTLREANESADKLVKIGANQHEKLRIIHSPPAALCFSLRVEAMGIPQMRG